MGKRKYPIVKDTWVYGHITPDGMIYIGYSCCDKCWKRWKPTLYYYSELQLYIDKFGWDNIKHVVFKDGLTEEQGRLLEGLLINQAMKDGWSINKIGSGGLYCDGNNDKYIIKEKRKEYNKRYHLTHKTEEKLYKEKNKEKIREYQTDYQRLERSTPEGKIYYRVDNFNRIHPDKKIETAREAKQKYIETGYIPSYIKNNDLI